MESSTRCRCACTDNAYALESLNAVTSLWVLIKEKVVGWSPVLRIDILPDQVCKQGNCIPEPVMRPQRAAPLVTFTGDGGAQGLEPADLGWPSPW